MHQSLYAEAADGVQIAKGAAQDLYFIENKKK